MKNIISYNNFKINESISVFLKNNYNKIFIEPNLNLNNLFNNFMKKIDNEKKVSLLFQNFIKNNQVMIVSEIKKLDSIDNINNIISDEIKYFYFTLKITVDKLQNDDFTISSIFEKLRDKRLVQLMSFPEDKFSNAIKTYMSDVLIPYLKNESEEIDKYKNNTITWLNLTLFDAIKQKTNILNNISSNNNMINSIDILSKQMKGSTNIEIKKIILNNITNMNKSELINLCQYLGINNDNI